MGHIHKKYYSTNATFHSDKAIQEIKESIGVVPDAINTMAKKYRISHSRIVDYIENRE
ncbi:22406_t:CDS:1, partial [Gigaspora margarita]